MNEIKVLKSSRGHILDHWIDACLIKLIKEVTEGLENYELDRASRPLADFVDDLSTWYLRRSRTRPEALPKLREVLLRVAVIMAPFMPFLAEDIYQRLKSEKDFESVHFEVWPRPEKVDTEILAKMREVRKIVSLALEARSRANIKVRQPLNELRIKNKKLGKEYLDLIRDELNVKNIVVNSNLEQEVELDIELTPELIEEGKLRDAIRSIQDTRKERGLKPNEKMKYVLSAGEEDFFKKHSAQIKKATNIEFED